MYALGTSSDAVYQYSLSTAWSVSSASYADNFSVLTQEGNSFGVSFSSDGTKLYIVGISQDTVYQYALSTAWSVGTASLSTSYSIAGNETSPLSLHFSQDGTKFYTTNQTGNLRQWSMSTPWAVNTASYVGTGSYSSQTGDARGVFFKSDGTKAFIIGVNGVVYRYNVATPWVASTISYDNQSFSVASQESTPQDLFIKPDGTKLYIVGTANDTVYQYSLT